MRGAPVNEFDERRGLARDCGGSFEDFVFCHGAVGVQVVLRPGVCLRVQDLACEGQGEERRFWIGPGWD